MIDTTPTYIISNDADDSIALNSLGYDALIVSAHPVARYAFSEPTGNVSLDSSGNEHHGTYRGVPIPTRVLDETLAMITMTTTNRVLALDGVSQTVLVQPCPVLMERTTFTVEFWLNTSDTDADLVRTKAAEGFLVSIVDGEFVINAGSAGELATGVPPSGVWQHIAVRFGPFSHTVGTTNHVGCDVFIDGALVASGETQYNSLTLDGTFLEGDDDQLWIGGEPAPEASLYSDLVLADGPVLYLRLDESEGVPAADTSPEAQTANYRHGVGTGTAFQGARGVAGAVDDNDAATFDGAGDHVRIADDATLRVDDTFTFTCYFKRDTLGEGYLYACGSGVGGDLGIHFNASDELSVSALGGGGVIVKTLEPITDDEWHHLGVTKDGAGTAAGTIIYIDGYPVELNEATQDLAIVSNTGEKTVGAQNINGTNSFSGTIDEAALFPTALTAEQILTHYLGFVSDDAPRLDGRIDDVTLHTGMLSDGEIALRVANDTMHRGLQVKDIGDGSESEPSVYGSGIGDGSRFGKTRLPGLRRSVQVKVRGTSWADREARESRLRSVLRGMTSGGGRVDWRQTEHGDARALAHVTLTDRPRVVEKHGPYRVVEFELSSELAHLVGEDRSAAGTESVAVVNNGHENAFPVVTVIGPVGGISGITVTASDGSLVSLPAAALAAGEELVFDSRRGTFEIEGVDARGQLDVAVSTRLVVPPGGTTFTVTADTGDAASTDISVQTYDAWPA